VHRFRIGVLTSGGDCPGLNAVIRAVVASAHTLGWEVLGFIDGYEGLLSPVNYRILTVENTQGIMSIGGTIIGTTNRGRFVAKSGHGEKAMIPQPIMPKTIDNDLSATATTFGFDSAVQCVADALDRLHTTAASHKRVMVLEVMGRHAGWIALHGGLAGGADAILIPEIPFSYDRLTDYVEKRMAGGAASTIIVVAEGATATGGEVSTLEGETKGEVRLGGIGSQVAAEIAKRTNRETRTVVLGHLQRGGAPTTQDRNLGTRFGVGAVQLIQEKKFGHMVSYLNYQIGAVTITEAVGQIKLVPPDGQMVNAAKAVGVSFGT
jgi:6-phosphofructokinase